MPRLILLLALLPAPAWAHLGHLGEVAGHGHWVAGAAVGAAVLAGLWGALTKPKAAPEPEEPDAEPEAEA